MIINSHWGWEWKYQESSSECYTINITPRFSLSLGSTYLVRTDCRLFLSFRSIPLVICLVLNDQQPGRSCAPLKPRIITWQLLRCWWMLSDSRTWFRTNCMGYKKRSWASRTKHGNTEYRYDTAPDHHKSTFYLFCSRNQIHASMQESGHSLNCAL